jgi:CheY-like chemotaxis protein
MRILFLDDDKERHRKVRQRFIGTVAVYVFNYNEAVAALTSNEPFDVAYLDHDLMEQTAAVEKTGYDVAAYIVAMAPDRRPLQIVVHSLNEVGRQRMAKLLADAGCHVSIEPFQVEL